MQSGTQYLLMELVRLGYLLTEAEKFEGNKLQQHA